MKKILFFFFIVIQFINCTSKSANAKLRNGIINHEKSTDNLDVILPISNNFFYYPTSKSNQIIRHKYFMASYSEKDEQAEWVFYKVSINNYNSKVIRTNDYREDPSVKTKSASPDDYKGSGYDMGHLAPAQAMSFSFDSMSESFFLSNISPQKAAFNRGIWKSLEGKVEYWSSFNDSIYVVTGPILDNPIDQIGTNKVNVPRAFFKTLISFKNGNAKGIAFMIPNEKSDKSIYSFATSIDEVEKITGINFYFELDKSAQDKAEANYDIKKWILIN
ncbi:DNA/RNA non-specific endonuclease [Polaribacter sp. BAL334]|uniref:DNA/RNA non-specific endonuclease n=1 Tax=Polaribacter sp. BAL334 TaxID=1708178 RepID=UPI0018D23D3F|nr:DNA/RNA non-specific endonuclease [Polaribacter sp. BAL334]MBG7613173.1 DNA/RNA non-specific endonuclease [Polaribacter sp. BAL334]